MSYQEFIESKIIGAVEVGFNADNDLYPDSMFPHQTVSVTWALKRGKAGLFFATGLGKTLAQIAWAHQVTNHTKGSVLILAPLAVSKQTQREGIKFGIECHLAEKQSDIKSTGIYITNYEKLHLFDTSIFSGVVLDESSILKGMTGKYRRLITDSFSNTPYRLSCTATPSPNDYMELGTQCEFLGIMTQIEMLAMYFIHDGGETSKWRLKGHGKDKFWEWVSSWAIFLNNPRDLGFDGDKYDLPPIEYHDYIVETKPTTGLFPDVAQSLIERNAARKSSIKSRCKQAADIANALSDPCIIWCHLNAESKLLSEYVDNSVEVKGSDTPQHKEYSMLAFSESQIKALITKPKIAGFGMNWQNTHHCIFVGLSDSWESFYQAIRRQWRFGQLNTVHVHVISADTEGAVLSNIRRKNEQNDIMQKAMMSKVSNIIKHNILGATKENTEYAASTNIALPYFLTKGHT